VSSTALNPQRGTKLVTAGMVARMRLKLVVALISVAGRRRRQAMPSRMIRWVGWLFQVVRREDRSAARGELAHRVQKARATRRSIATVGHPNQQVGCVICDGEAQRWLCPPESFRVLRRQCSSMCVGR